MASAQQPCTGAGAGSRRRQGSRRAGGRAELAGELARYLGAVSIAGRRSHPRAAVLLRVLLGRADDRHAVPAQLHRRPGSSASV